MALQDEIMVQMKEAMKAKDKVALEALRAIKSAILLANTEKGSGDAGLSAADEIKLVQRLVKQRKDSATIFKEQGREDLASAELDQISVIEKFLPAQLSEAEVEKIVADTISEVGAGSMKDMGKVMGLVTKKIAGQADGKTVSSIVKQKLAT